MSPEILVKTCLADLYFVLNTHYPTDADAMYRKIKDSLQDQWLDNVKSYEVSKHDPKA